jgi:PAS domain S-box-containing protein
MARRRIPRHVFEDREFTMTALMAARNKIKILCLEDVPADAAMVSDALRKSGLDFQFVRVESKEAFLGELEDGPPDVILSDHGLPAFDGFMALAGARDKCPGVPFIFVTGGQGEQQAIEAFECGATDYVLKGRLSELAPAVRRALRETDARAQLRQQERALRDSEERFRMLMDGVRDYAIFMLDQGERVASWNAGAEHIFGYNAADIVGKDYSVLLTSRDVGRGRQHSALSEAADTGRHEEGGLRVRRSGENFHANVVTTALRDEKGNLTGFAQVTRDVTAQRQAEAALRKSEALKSAILATALDAIISVDHEGLVQEWNPAAGRIFGYSRRQVLGKPLDELIVPPSLRATYRDGLTDYLMTGVGSLLDRPVEMTLRRADGSEFTAEMAITRVPTEDPPRCTALVRDITARKKAESELRASEERLRLMVLELNAQLERRVPDRSAQLESISAELEAISQSVPRELRPRLQEITTRVEALQKEANGKLSREET